VQGLTCAGVFALLCALAPAAGARVVVDPVTHKRFGVLTPPGAAGARQAAARTPERAARTRSGSTGAAAPVRPFAGGTCLAEKGDCSKLTYHGGPVQHSEHDYLFFWTPSGHAVPAEYKSGIETWLDEVAAADYSAGNPFSVNQQYYEGSGESKSFVPYAVEHAGTIVDTNAYPASRCTDSNGRREAMPVCLTDAQLHSQLESYVSAHGLPTGMNVEYFIMTPAGVGSCFDESSAECSYTSYCGYHTAAGSPTPLIYADIPWSYQEPNCDTEDYPNPPGYIDAVLSVFSHELSETMTDPEISAWYQEGGTDAGDEIGDKCAYVYGSGGYNSFEGLPNNGSGYWNVKLEANEYLLQLEFDNRTENCAIADTDTQPSVSLAVNPEQPRQGSSASFTANVTDPAGVSSVSWAFGDGGSATGTSVSHTYATSGEQTVTAVVTDNHGNEARVSKTITVIGPHATFSATPSPATAGAPVELNGEASSDSAAPITSYRWSFGEVGEGEGARVSHTYKTSGRYTVKLTVTDELGLTSTHEEVITVWAPQTVTSVQPAEGPEAGGTSVAIRGTGFEEASGVRFGSVPASGFERVSPTEVRATSPPGAGVVDVHVEGPLGESAPAEGARFTYLAPAGGSGTGGGSGGSGEPGSGATTTTSTTTAASPPPEALAGARKAAAPTSAFGIVGRPRINRRTGAITFSVSVSDPGTLHWALTFRNGSLGVVAIAAARSGPTRCGRGRIRIEGRCRRAQLLFARGSRAVAKAGIVTITVKPGAVARRALAAAVRERRSLAVSALLTYSASGARGAASHAVRVLDRPAVARRRP
jgi:PKD repeat protein